MAPLLLLLKTALKGPRGIRARKVILVPRESKGQKVMLLLMRILLRNN
jgi:hypothetical protein